MSSLEREVAVRSLRAAAILLILGGMASAVLADTIAYVVPAGTPGNQQFTGSLGLDFNVNSDIVITQLGVFHDSTFLSPDIQAPLEARLYMRNDANPCIFTLLATLDFTPDNEGTAMDSSFFKPLDTPIMLPAGFTGTIVASGYGGIEQNGNTNGGNPVWYTDDGGGLISFVGGGRFGNPSDPTAYPKSIDGGPPNRYAAGTFIFNATGGDAALPPDGILQDCRSASKTIAKP
jgi:hypothetical protein